LLFVVSLLPLADADPRRCRADQEPGRGTGRGRAAERAMI